MLYTNSKYTNVYESTNKKNILYIAETNLHVIYLMECLLYKVQYVGKLETPLQLRLNNQISIKEVIPACHHFKIDNHNFTLMAQIITEISKVNKDTLRLKLK